MNAVERLEAAIAKLEALKAKSTPGPWFLTYERATHPRLWGNASEDGQDADPVAQASREGNAELIVTMHRTIDAQLAILRFGIERAEYLVLPVELGLAPDVENALALADAILGCAS